MSGMTITAAIGVVLVAITLWVFAGGGGGQKAATTAPAPGTAAACQTPNGSNCVQAAQNLVHGLNGQSSAQPTPPGYSSAP
jgi:hypothetical protein